MISTDIEHDDDHVCTRECDYRFAVRVEADGSIRMEIGHAFGDADTATLTAAENAVRKVLADHG